MVLKNCIGIYISRWSEKFPTQPTTDVKLGTSDRWVGTRTRVDVTSTLVLSFFGSQPIAQRSSAADERAAVQSIDPWTATNKAFY